MLSRDDLRTAQLALAAEPSLGRPLPTLSERDLASIFSAEFAAQVVAFSWRSCGEHTGQGLF